MDTLLPEICCVCCQQSKELYNNINKEGMWWLTISPEYNDRKPQLDYDSFLKDDLYTMRSAFKNVLGVAELTTQMRLHYHMVFSIKDNIKLYKRINSMRRYGVSQGVKCNIKLYKGNPREGLHYLFKDIEFTRTFISDPIYTNATIEAIKANNMNKKKHEALYYTTDGFTKHTSHLD